MTHDLNRRIAVLRGGEWPTGHIWEDSHGLLRVATDEQEDVFDPEQDWAQAGVLLEELPPDVILTISGDGTATVNWAQYNNVYQEGYSNGPTPQKTICRAWIARKESTL